MAEHEGFNLEPKAGRPIQQAGIASNGRAPPAERVMTERERALDALQAIRPIDRDTWIKGGMCAKDAGLPFDDFHAWSKTEANYAGENDCLSVWKSFPESTTVKEGPLFALAMAHGWQDPNKGKARQADRIIPRPKQTAPRPANQAARVSTAVLPVWELCVPAPPDYSYLLRKGILPDGLRMYPTTAPTRIIQDKKNNELHNVAGWLVVPCWQDEELQTIQFISGEGKKLNLPGAHFNAGFFTVGEIEPDSRIFICEGIGQAAACHAATDAAAVACFGAARMATVAKSLGRKYPKAQLILVPDRGKEADAEKIARAINCEWCALPADMRANDDANDYALEHGADALAELLARATSPALPGNMASGATMTDSPPAGPASTVDLVEVRIDDVLDAEPQSQQFFIEEIIPRGVPSMLSSNGGVGKSMLALLAGICVSMELLFLGKRTQRGKVLFYSAEDSADHLRYRVGKICRYLKVDPREVAKNLIIVDVTDTDPALFCEISEHGIKRGITTLAYAVLAEFIAAREIDFLIIDNASDVFDSHEIERARVRAFIRSLARLIKQRNGSVLLLGHVDKSSASGTRTSQGYSGSTAWNNSVRSRLFMSESDTGVVLDHQKSNHGKKAAPLNLCWTDGILTLDGDGTGKGFLKTFIPAGDTTAVLGLIIEFHDRREYISPATTSPDNAYMKLQGEKGFPANMKRARLVDLLRKAEQGGLLVRETYKTACRKDKECWTVTPAGIELVRQAAPSAPSMRNP